MQAREGGSYVADPGNGEAKRVEGTVQEDASRVEPVEPVEAPFAPAATPVADPPPPARRRRTQQTGE